MRPPNGKRGRSRGRNKGGHGSHGGGGGGGHGHNNANRTLESNGPDVKIRGTAAHIHEKYLALARDSHSSGDRVGAENYLQHAEHYHRVMMSLYPQGIPQNQGQQGQGLMNGNDEGGDDDGPSYPPQQAHNNGNYPNQPSQQQPGGQVQQQAQPVQQPQPQPQQVQPPQPTPRSDGEEALAFDRRLNGRSRRIAAEDRNARAITSLETEKPGQGSDDSADDADEAIV